MKKFGAWLEGRIISDPHNIVVTPKPAIGEYSARWSIVDTKTHGSAAVAVVKHFNPEKLDNDGESIVILRWDAAPIFAPNKDEYKGGGFARNAMRKILELAQERKIGILEIFGPSEDSQRVLNHYTRKGVITPIPYSKAALADFHTAFRINKYSVE